MFKKEVIIVTLVTICFGGNMGSWTRCLEYGIVEILAARPRPSLYRKWSGEHYLGLLSQKGKSEQGGLRQISFARI